MLPLYDIKNEKWSDLQAFCYERNCICEDCFYKQYNEGKCKVKKALIEKIRFFGLESGVKTKQWLSD
jgi:hypothetical protein